MTYAVAKNQRPVTRMERCEIRDSA